MEARTGALNYGRYDNPEYNRLMLEAEGITDLNRRAQVLARAEAIAMEDQPVAPIYYYISKQLVSPRLKNWHDNPADKHNTRWLSF